MPASTTTMHVALGTLTLRPYVFGFLVAFLLAGQRDLGWRRTLGFMAWVWSLAWLAEFSSTRVGVPFGLYHYTGSTQGRELYVADVPFMDSLSFTFLAYAAFSLARLALGRHRPPAAVLAGMSGALMMLLDVVIDPLAVRGDRWFLGRIFYYPEGGPYFGVPLSNFLGWWIVGTLAVGGYLLLSGDARGRRPGRGAALYYAVAVFNLAVTLWIGEPVLASVGLALHLLLAIGLRYLHHTARTWLAFHGSEVQSA